MTLHFAVHGTPAPQGSKRAYVNRHTGRAAVVESSTRVRPWREAVKHAALDARVMAAATLDARPATLATLTGPVVVAITFYLPRPKSHYRTGRFAHLLRDNAPRNPAGKPDLDKLARSTLDGLSDAAVWADDAQVVSLSVAKAYAMPGDRIARGALITVTGVTA